MKPHLLLALFILPACHSARLATLAPLESYPNDSWLQTVNTKTAVIIVAHDDDAISCSGTIAQLCREGWNIREFCFYNDLPELRQRNEQRQKDLNTVAAIEGLRSVQFAQFNYRNDFEKNDSSYMPVDPEKFDEVYQVDSMYTLIGNFIRTNRPSVIFTLDDVIGGYGNPDHKFVSMLILQYCREHRNDEDFSVQKIYQPVYTPTQSNEILNNLPVYIAAKKVYQCAGMPEPDLQINITSVAKTKKMVMRSYSTEQNSIQKIWPYYKTTPAHRYFSIFDREFFRVISIDTSE